MENRTDEITKAIEKVENVQIIRPFVLDDIIVKGAIEITVDSTTLTFEVEIYSPYPFQYHDFETVRFVNKELITYNHVNSDGSICVHTLHSPDLETKIALDINSLKHWVIKYFINREKDDHYEHIVVSPSGTGKNQALWFTDVDYPFTPGQFGQFHFSLLNSGNVKKKQFKLLSYKSLELKVKKPSVHGIKTISS